MGYAIRNDMQGWRAVDSEEDCLSDEYYSLVPVDLVITTQVPQKVTMRQARLALHNAGKLVDVEVAINALLEPSRTSARIEWDFSSEVHRDKEFVVMMGAALGLSNAQLDDLFVQAALL